MLEVFAGVVAVYVFMVYGNHYMEHERRESQIVVRRRLR
jgi:hypothetical protein